MLTYFKEALRDHPDEAELTEEETKKRLDERLCVRPLGEGRLRILICPKNRVDQEVSDIVSSLAQKYSCELCDAFVRPVYIKCRAMNRSDVWIHALISTGTPFSSSRSRIFDVRATNNMASEC